MANHSVVLPIPSTSIKPGTAVDISDMDGPYKSILWAGASSDSVLTVEGSVDGAAPWAPLCTLQGSAGVDTIKALATFARLVRRRGTGGDVRMEGIQTEPATGPQGPAGPTGPTGPTGLSPSVRSSATPTVDELNSRATFSALGQPIANLAFFVGQLVQAVETDGYAHSVSGLIYSMDAGMGTITITVLGVSPDTGPSWDPTSFTRWLIGPVGAKGDRGDTGAAGDPGAQGIPGPQGIQGIQGAQGIQGIQGPQGAAGNNGTNGIGLGDFGGAVRFQTPDATPVFIPTGIVVPSQSNKAIFIEVRGVATYNAGAGAGKAQRFLLFGCWKYPPAGPWEKVGTTDLVFPNPVDADGLELEIDVDITGHVQVKATGMAGTLLDWWALAVVGQAYQ